MATLYVENVPDDLYEALRQRARSHRKSIAAEVVSLLEHWFSHDVTNFRAFDFHLIRDRKESYA